MGILELLKAVGKGLVKQDDAAKQIAELGYPESVAKRIASGELPMDEASRLARAKEQGFNTKNRLLHGTDADIKAFDKEMRGSSTDARSANMATWFTDDPLTAGSYANYAAMDSKVKKLLDEADKAGNAGDWDKYDSLLRQAEELENSFMNTANRRRGQNIIPVYTKDDLAQVDMGGRSFDDYGTSDEIANRIAIEKSRGRAGVQFNELDDAAGLAYQPATHVAVPDNANIRSVNAAFDPEYKGSSILGALAKLGIGVGSGALGMMSPEEQLFAAPAQRQPEMRAIGGNDTEAQAATRNAAQTLGELLLSGDSPEITSTRGAGETMMKIANNQPIGIMDALEVAGQVEPTQYPALIKALYNYSRQQ